MDCLCASAIFFLCLATFLVFIAVSVTSWMSFLTKSDFSLLVQWSGLYQTCKYEEDCRFDLWERPLEGKMVFFLMIGSTLMLLIGLMLLLSAELKSRKYLFIVSGCFSIFGGLIIASAVVLYTINIDWEPYFPKYTPIAFHGACYYIAWTSSVSSTIAGILSIIKRWKYDKGIVPVQRNHLNAQRRRHTNTSAFV